jgi:hypothetical protein
MYELTHHSFDAPRSSSHREITRQPAKGHNSSTTWERSFGIHSPRLSVDSQLLQTSSAAMSPQDVPATTGVDAAPPAPKEQDINPWSVEGAQDETGQVAAIDYATLSRQGGSIAAHKLVDGRQVC